MPDAAGSGLAAASLEEEALSVAVIRAGDRIFELECVCVCVCARARAVAPHVT